MIFAFYRVDPQVDNSHQVWSWYDHQLPSYSIFVCRYVTWHCDLDLWPFDLEQMSYRTSHVTNLATEYEDPTPVRSLVMSYNVSHWLLPLKMCTWPLRMCRITWPMSRGSKQLHIWNSRSQFSYSLYNFGGSMMKVIKVICENNVRPRVKRHMGFCACAKSRDLLKVPEMYYCSRSGRRRFTALDFKSWTYSRIYGHFRQHLYCACAETVISELPV